MEISPKGKTTYEPTFEEQAMAKIEKRRLEL